MLLLVPKRISLRGIFVVVTVCALALGVWREWHRLGSANEDFKSAKALWQFKQITFTDTVAAADALYEVELKTLWIPRRKATRRQVERLTYLADSARAGVSTTMFGTFDGRDRLLRECDEVEAKAAKLTPDLAP